MSTTDTLEHPQSSIMVAAYRAAVEQWIEAIGEEEALASVDPTVAQVDTWEKAHFKEEKARDVAKKAKADYEDAIRKGLFHF